MLRGPSRSRSSLPLALGVGLGALASACGDVGTVRLDVDFADEQMSSRTRALLVVVREPPAEGDGCDALWSEQSTGLAESRAVVEWPSRNDILATPVKLSIYPALTFLVYAYPDLDVNASEPIAGGCVGAKVPGDEASELTIPLVPRP
jgi:hypothetical protein